MMVSAAFCANVSPAMSGGVFGVSTFTYNMREAEGATRGPSISLFQVRDTIVFDPTVFNGEAADTIVSRKVKSLPVVEDGRVVGVVYRSALYRSIAENILQRACAQPQDS